MFITLPNVTRLSYYNLQPLFEKQLASQLAEMGIRKRRVDHYLQQGGQWQINEAIRRKQVIRFTRNIVAMKKMKGELPPEMAVEVIRQSVSYDADKTRNYFKKLPAWQEPKKHDNIIPIDPIQLYNIFRQICYISKYREKSLANAGSRIGDQFRRLQRLNCAMITAFIEANRGELSDDSLSQYQESLDLYFNEFLAGRYLTVLQNEALDLEEPLSHGYSFDEMLQTKTAMQEFYQFLFDQDLINHREWLSINGILDNELQNDDSSADL